MMTPEDFNSRGAGMLPGLMGIEVTEVGKDRMTARLALRRDHLAPNGFLHAGTVITLADTLCGYATVVNLPDGATGFTTIELKSNFLGTALEGTLQAVATPLHRGRSTQIWDAVVSHGETGREMAHFRCTQMVLWPKS